MRVEVRPAARGLAGEVATPGDKSISHRAALFAAIAGGRSELWNFAPGDDCRRTLSAVRQLGVAVRGAGDGGPVVIDGPGWGGWREPDDVLDCGNSGTTLRLLCGALAGRDGFYVLTGDASLRRRPMRRVVEPLRRMGAAVDGRGGGAMAPIVVRGARLVGASFATQVASAQVKSCLLIAGLAARGETWVKEPYLSRDHTERMLPLAGVQVRRGPRGVGVSGPAGALRPFALAIPGDPSAAAFFAAAAALVPESRVMCRGVCLNPTRAGFFTRLGEMMGDEPARGGAAEPPAGPPTGPPAGPPAAPEPAADMVFTSPGRPLRATVVGHADVPALIDELPLLAVLATQAHGVTRVSGAAELRHKETDRLASLAAELRRLGAAIAELPDGWSIAGPTPLSGGAVSAHGDHRLAMALAAAALAARGPVVIEGAESVDASYPGFFDVLRALGAAVEAAD